MELKILVIVLFLIGAILEFIEVKLHTLKITLRKDITSTLSGTIFALVALLIWLFG